MAEFPAPILGISDAEAAEILGIRELSVARLVMRGVLHKPVKGQRYALDRDEVEQLALERWRPGHPYWMSSSEAAEVLGIGSTRIHELLQVGKLPGVRYGHRWFFRRHEIEVIANAREARLLA